jgi:pyruvate,water dikinase
VRWPVPILKLEDCTDVEQVGGKALSLGTMIRAGFPVPDGFAVTTSAFASGRVPEAEIRAAYAALGDDVAVAVRSSATSEDAADASCAGQYDTYLQITGADDVIRHVERCWGSLNTGRALAYRRDRQIDEPLMAVAVQRMFPARAAGVAMTLNPSNGDRSKIAVEAAPGVGEAVVSGEVTPDHFLLDKVMLDVVSTRPADGAAGPCLTTAEVKAVARLAKLVERHYGRPQDIEWAIDAGGATVLLQARPETVWANKPQPRSGESYMTGLGSLVNTLINPLAQRRTSGVDADH